jgi:hypothetical protein
MYVIICTYMVQFDTMEVPITQFRRRLFELFNHALEGKEVWVSHKGRRVRILPEEAPSKLSRVTPMQIIVPGADPGDDSWKVDITREWEEKWNRKLGPRSKSVRAATGHGRTTARKARRSA